MKKVLSIFAALCFFAAVYAQNDQAKAGQSGTIRYNEIKKSAFITKDNMTVNASSNSTLVLPKETCKGTKLCFNPDATLYLNDKESENDGSLKQKLEGGATITIQTFESTAENKIFTDLKNKKQVEQREFMTRLFLIEREIDIAKWKITGKQKTILGYPCQEAVLQKEGEKTIAWFTPAIAVSSGPDKFYGLPGMILAIESSDGKHAITAISVDLEPIDKNLLEIPKKGKKVTEEKFAKIVEKKKKENDGNINVETVTLDLSEGQGGMQVFQNEDGGSVKVDIQ